MYLRFVKFTFKYNYWAFPIVESVKRVINSFVSFEWLCVWIKRYSSFFSLRKLFHSRKENALRNFLILTNEDIYDYQNIKVMQLTFYFVKLKKKSWVFHKRYFSQAELRQNRNFSSISHCNQVALINVH